MTKDQGESDGSLIQSPRSADPPPRAQEMPTKRAALFGSTTLRTRVRLINGVFAAGIIAFTLITHYALKVQLVTTDELIRLNEAEEYAQDADRLHDSLRGDLYAALLAPQRRDAEGDSILRTWQTEIARFHDDLEHQSALVLPEDVTENINLMRERAEEYLIRTEDLMALAGSEGQEVIAQLPDFEERFRELAVTFDGLNSLLWEESQQAKVTAATARDDAERIIVLAAALIIAGTLLLTWTITHSIRRSVHQVSAVARALAAGQLEVRYEHEAADEVGAIGRSLNAMAGNLQKMMQRMLSDTEHDRFNKQLTDAFEIADSEPAVTGVVSRAMKEIAAVSPMELLLADSSQSRLKRGAEHPVAGAPGCPVQTPAACVAVRRGNAATFPDSGQLNACPYLQDRGESPVAAVCVPLSFMGKSLGVLHATSSLDEPFGEQGILDMETLAQHAANRIGTVRAFQRAQMQAMTDAMTGLSNRRALESEVGEMLRGGQSFAVLMADLDYFKKLNDTFGHQAGDQALQLFAEVIRSCMRADDRAARWGGEEFVVVLGGASAKQGAEWARRLRASLAERCQILGVPKFTASFGIADSSMWPDLPGLLRIADTALYISKKDGRDRSTVGSADAALGAGDDEYGTDGSDPVATVDGVAIEST